MDKASVRILFLALIAVMFIGQAVYDFVKKNRGQATRRRPAPRPKTSHSVVSKPTRITPTPLSYPHQDDPSDSSVSLSQLAPSAEPDSEPESPASPSPQSDELRRAIIWSEILKRKF
ncbi:MAG: hypothetical protein K2J10_05920 [Muribaculaceae bacterium]|nr:hypothetical protein [Muribaculaceae bacterium]